MGLQMCTHPITSTRTHPELIPNSSRTHPHHICPKLTPKEKRDASSPL